MKEGLYAATIRGLNSDDLTEAVTMAVHVANVKACSITKGCKIAEIKKQLNIS